MEVRTTLKKLILEVMSIDIDKIDNNKKLSTIDEWDSFNNLMLISKVEDFYKIKFSIGELEDIDTVAKIIKIVEKKGKK